MNILFFIVIFIPFPAVHVLCGEIGKGSDSEIDASWGGTTSSTPPSFFTTTEDSWGTTVASPPPTSDTTTTEKIVITFPDDLWTTTGGYYQDLGPTFGKIGVLVYCLIAVGIGISCVFSCCCCYLCLRNSKLGFGHVNNIMSRVNADAESDVRGFEPVASQLDNQQSQHTAGTENYAYHQQDAYYDDNDAPPPPYSSLTFDNDNDINNGVTITVSQTSPPISLPHPDHSVIELDKDSSNVT